MTLGLSVVLGGVYLYDNILRLRPRGCAVTSQIGSLRAAPASFIALHAIGKLSRQFLRYGPGPETALAQWADLRMSTAELEASGI